MDLNFEKMNGLIPAIIQDNSTNKVLMLGFMLSLIHISEPTRH
mgnify:CR=1 FL=1